MASGLCCLPYWETEKAGQPFRSAHSLKAQQSGLVSRSAGTEDRVVCSGLALPWKHVVTERGWAGALQQAPSMESLLHSCRGLSCCPGGECRATARSLQA